MYVYYDGYNRGFSVKSLLGGTTVIPIRNLLRDGSGGGSDDDILF